eukprot:4577554-Prymnesium_polylepis.1
MRALLLGSVDDLKDIANLDKYIARTKAVLVFCSDGYFTPKNFMIELRACVKQGKRIVSLVDPDASRGGLTKDQVHEQLLNAEKTLFERWGFVGDGDPSAKELYRAFFARSR